MKIKKISALGSALLLSVSTLLSIGFNGTAFAAAAYTCTWTGATNSNFNTAGNWTGCNNAAPVTSDGDNLVFDSTNLSADKILNNDITNLTVGTITFQGTNTNYYKFTLTGNGLSLSNGITQLSKNSNIIGINLTLLASQTFAISNNSSLYVGDYNNTGGTTLALGGYNLTINGPTNCAATFISSTITGTGNIISNSYGLSLNAASPNYTGAVSVNQGMLSANDKQFLGTGSSGVTVADGASIIYGQESDTTYSQPLSVSGNGFYNFGAIRISSPFIGSFCGQGGPGGSAGSVIHVILSGHITLSGNATAAFDNTYDLTVTGVLSGTNQLTVNPGSSGTLIINSSNNTSQTSNGNQTAPKQTVTIASGDNQSSVYVSVGTNQTYVIDGIRGFTNVSDGGILEGTGTVNGLDVASGGTVSPGHSPGCLTVTGDYQSTGTYLAELGGTTACSGYDQINVSGNVDLTDGAVPPTAFGKLSVVLYGGFKPAAGQTYEIINNQGAKPVVGTFTGLAEGAQFTVSGYVLKISYIGGTGNDVVLTVVSVPKTPDTGAGMINSNTILPVITIMGISASLIIISRKFKKVTVRK